MYLLFSYEVEFSLMDSKQVCRKGFSMKRNNILAKLLVAGAVSSISAFAIMTVDKSNGVLTVRSDINGIVIAKIINPNDKVVVNKQFKGSSFSWTPSGSDGTYRYDVKVIPTQIDPNGDKQNRRGNYAGGMLEVKDGQIFIKNGAEQ